MYIRVKKICTVLQAKKQSLVHVIKKKKENGIG